MKKVRFPGKAVLAITILTLAAAGCSRSASSQIETGFSPFSAARNQAVTLVGSTKRSLDAADVNSLAVVYTALQEKANAYADFMVESVMTSSFDTTRNASYAADFASAIANFDKSYASLMVTQRAKIDVTWVSPFAQGLQARWNRYSSDLAKLTPQQKADVIAQLKRETVWPNYEDIATEPVAVVR